jgi:hypothetical protein
VNGAPINFMYDSDGDGLADFCDPNYVVPCDGVDIVIQNIQYMDMTTIRASQTISTGNNEITVLAGADVTYVALQSVELEPGFQTQLGGLFHVYIDECVELVQKILAQLPRELDNSQDRFSININPALGVTEISYDLKEASPIVLEVYDDKGERMVPVLNTTSSQNAGAHTVTLDTSNLPSGVLMALLRTNRGIRYKRFSNPLSLNSKEK